MLACPNGYQIGHDFEKHSECNSSECVEECLKYCRRYKKTCVDKADYGSEIIAKQAAYLFANYPGQFDYYECPFCGGWHIGRSSRLED